MNCGEVDAVDTVYGENDDTKIQAAQKSSEAQVWQKQLETTTTDTTRTRPGARNTGGIKNTEK